MKFTKMQGCGNDYVYVNGFSEKVEDPVSLARFVSDRHFGIGSDGLILIQPSSQADCAMEMYNADGSRGKMCGNGIRCVGKYFYDHGLTEKTHITVETLAGIKKLDLLVKEGTVSSVRVDMGSPIFAPEKIPVLTKEEDPEGLLPVESPLGRIVKESPVSLGGLDVLGTAVSMGNPHFVIRMEELESLPLDAIGPAFEHAHFFPERINTEFIQILDEENIRMRVWERGSGETWACGTGACAAAAASALNGWTKNTVTVHLLGGDLLIEWERKANTIYMTGPAVTVFEGEI